MVVKSSLAKMLAILLIIKININKLIEKAAKST